MTVQSNSTIAIIITMLSFNILRQYFQPVRSKTNCTLYAPFFPRCKQVTGNSKEFFDWFIMLFVLVVIGGINYFNFVFFFWESFGNCYILQKWLIAKTKNSRDNKFGNFMPCCFSSSTVHSFFFFTSALTWLPQFNSGRKYHC